MSTSCYLDSAVSSCFHYVLWHGPFTSRGPLAPPYPRVDMGRARDVERDSEGKEERESGRKRGGWRGEI